jgi:hypothetical protein
VIALGTIIRIGMALRRRGRRPGSPPSGSKLGKRFDMRLAARYQPTRTTGTLVAPERSAIMVSPAMHRLPTETIAVAPVGR